MLRKFTTYLVAFALSVVFAVALVTPANAQDGTPCIGFGPTILLNPAQLETPPVSIVLEPGSYVVTTLSEDLGHPVGNETQLNEQWSIVDNNGLVIAGPTSDIPTEDTAVSDTFRVEITEPVSSVFARHLGVSNVNSVHPVQACFELIPPPPTTTTTTEPPETTTTTTSPPDTTTTTAPVTTTEPPVTTTEPPVTTTEPPPTTTEPPPVTTTEPPPVDPPRLAETGVETWDVLAWGIVIVLAGMTSLSATRWT